MAVWFCVVVAVLGVAGFVVAVVLYLRRARRKRLAEIAAGGPYRFQQVASGTGPHRGGLDLSEVNDLLAKLKDQCAGADAAVGRDRTVGSVVMNGQVIGHISEADARRMEQDQRRNRDYFRSVGPGLPAFGAGAWPRAPGLGTSGTVVGGAMGPPLPPHLRPPEAHEPAVLHPVGWRKDRNREAMDG